MKKIRGTDKYVVGSRSRNVVAQDIDLGDSGGALFKDGPNDYYVYMGGVLNEQSNIGDDEDSDCGGDDAKSTTAGRIENNFPGQFDK